MLSGNVFFDENVPEEIRGKIAESYKKGNNSLNFLIEMPDEKTISIVAENGFVKNLPIEEVSAEDILNLMDEMSEIVYENHENSETEDEKSKQADRMKKLLSKWRKEDFERKFHENPKTDEEVEKPAKFIKGGIKLTDNIEFFPWAKKRDRFGISVFATSEEKWAFGAEGSVGLSFLRIGARFKKGINLKLADNSVPWESYGLNIRFDIADIYNVRFSAGFEVALYSVKNVLFNREFFIFRIAYRIKWFEAAASFNVTPSVVELGLFGAKHEMNRYNFVMSLGALF
ncbi:hypothetical protein J5690_06505 [bacterium]|nr:hypothetical protein [bacterium]